jgi:hypothetical protein
MYVTLTLSHAAMAAIKSGHSYTNLQELDRLLRQRLGVFYDGLLVKQKIAEQHASVVDVHVGATGRHINRSAIVELVNTRLSMENVVFGMIHTHIDGIPHDFADGYIEITD